MQIKSCKLKKLSGKPIKLGLDQITMNPYNISLLNFIKL